jgi:hypothetical protein
MDRFMGKNGHKKAQRMIDQALRPERVPAPAPVEEPQKLFPGQPVERETPSESKYLAPSEGGPRRLIIMLSDDGTIIEPLGVFGGLTILQQTSLVAQMNGILVENPDRWGEDTRGVHRAARTESRDARDEHRLPA